MTSPVDFISGPSTVSTPGNFDQGKTGDFTKYPEPVERSAERSTLSGRNSRSFLPVIRRAAIFARGTPVALETKGTVREALGFTSITYSARASLKVYL